MYKNYKIKNFIDLDEQEKKEILKWRNHPNISKYMLTKNISLKEHLKFIENLKQNNKKQYFLVDNIGVIYFKIYQNYVEIGLYKNPEKRKVGNKLLKTAIDYAFNNLKSKKIILYVFEENKKAINLYKKFKFKEVDKKDNIIKMELLKSEKLKDNYENRKV